MKKIALALACVAMSALVPTASLRGDGDREAHAASATFPVRVDPPNAIHARVTFTNGNDVRAIASSLDGDAVWAATSGGLDRYDAITHARTHFGIESGLDSLDVRAIHVTTLALVVDTAESRCVGFETFRCFASRPPAPNAPSEETFHDAPVVARIAVKNGDFVATRGHGTWFHGAADTRLDEAPTAPTSFVRKLAFYKHRRFAGTFDDGLVTIDSHGTHAIPSAPMRMVNDLVATDDALFVAANEGLFFSRDGLSFQRIDAIGHGVTGIATTRDHVWVTTTSAIWRLHALRKNWSVDANWWRPAGTRSLQGVAISEKVGWLASEDRGVIRFDPSSSAPRFVAFDKLAGAKASWVVALAGDDRGGVFAATLRDGVFHVDANGALANVNGVPNPWTLDVSFSSGELCVGTQSGGACWRDWTKAPTTNLAGLPDGRVHDVERDGSTLFIATEAGLATST